MRHNDGDGAGRELVQVQAGLETMLGEAAKETCQQELRIERRRLAGDLEQPAGEALGRLEQAQGLPDGQRQMREAFLVPMLRESLVLWVDIAGDKVTEKAKRDAEMAPVYAQVDELLLGGQQGTYRTLQILLERVGSRGRWVRRGEGTGTVGHARLITYNAVV